MNRKVAAEPEQANLQTAQERLARAQAEYQAATAQAEREAHEAELRRAEALRDWDETELAQFDARYRELTEKIKETRQAYESAVLADPVNQAVVAYVGAMRARLALEMDRRQIRIRLGLVAPDAPSEVREQPRLEIKFVPDDITRILDTAVHNAWADSADERDQERIDVGEAAARQSG